MRIREFAHARVRNDALSPVGDVGYFLRGRRASMRREQMFGPVLTHWDEAAAYAVLAHLAPALSQI